MVRLKFPITPFSLCSQSNPTPKTRSLTPLICGGGCGRNDASSSGGGMALFGFMANYGDVD
ncbi:unnamed protein product [Prunus armeniaca]